jgi:hypothetical protein
VPLVDFAGHEGSANMPAFKYMQTRRLGNDIMIHGRMS